VDIAIPVLMIAVWLALAAYDIRHQGFLWFYQWRKREDAPVLFAVSIITYIALSIYMTWLIFQVRGWHLPVKL